ncbi:aldose reductase-related protein 2-like isoform X2 [Ptychodera flava]|uniref:aldose reductase-related protein 2-like isoform X2 n=1 Tax=Ptychodera flava TaxID=63121 RepID=UPI00396AAF96
MLRHSVVRSVSQLFAASKQVRRISSRTGIPVIGLGTSQMYGDELKTALHCAIGLGYRHIDCAAVYYNERIIGDVLKENLNEAIAEQNETKYGERGLQTKSSRSESRLR